MARAEAAGFRRATENELASWFGLCHTLRTPEAWSPLRHIALGLSTTRAVAIFVDERDASMTPFVCEYITLHTTVLVRTSHCPGNAAALADAANQAVAEWRRWRLPIGATCIHFTAEAIEVATDRLRQDQRALRRHCATSS